MNHGRILLHTLFRIKDYTSPAWLADDAFSVNEPHKWIKEYRNNEAEPACLIKEPWVYLECLNHPVKVAEATVGLDEKISVHIGAAFQMSEERICSASWAAPAISEVSMIGSVSNVDQNSRQRSPPALRLDVFHPTKNILGSISTTCIKIQLSFTRAQAKWLAKYIP